MRTRFGLAILMFAAFSALAFADLEPWKDYETSEAIWEATTVKVHANMGDAYLEGLKKTWAAGNKVAKELGHIEDWKILRSDLPLSGQFNLLLMVKYRNAEAMAPNKKRYEEFIAKWGKERLKESTEFAQKNYPAMREITGQYNLREITLK